MSRAQRLLLKGLSSVKLNSTCPSSNRNLLPTKPLCHLQVCHNSSSVVPPTKPNTTIANTSLLVNKSPSRNVATSQKFVENRSMEETKLLSESERRNFNAIFPDLVEDIVGSPELHDMPDTNNWMTKVLEYNVKDGKQNRGLATALAYRYLADDLTKENIHLSYVLGWCVEMLQAFFLVADDIMDSSETRRGRPCWHLVGNSGPTAFNDAVLLDNVVYKLLQKYFRGKSYYLDILEAFHDITFKTAYGQSLDTRTGLEKRMDTYTLERYSSIVKYKTSYYSFFLPVSLAMAMSGIRDRELLKQAEDITLALGHFFQVQDDYLDCFGDVEVTGKIGTDIQDVVALVVVALQKANDKQRQLLIKNYGENDPGKIEIVKQLYLDMQLPETYLAYEEQNYDLITTQIQQLSPNLPKRLFHDMLKKIYKRKQYSWNYHNNSKSTIESESKECSVKALSGPSGDFSVQSKYQTVSDFISRFTWIWSKALSDTNKGNVAFSPTRVGSTIFALLLGSDGNTREEFLNAFKFIQDEADLKKEYRALLEILNGESNNNNEEEIYYSTSQKLFHSVGDGIQEDYIEMLRSVFKSETQPLDFTARVGAFRKFCVWLDSVGVKGIDPVDIKAALHLDVLPRLIFVSTLRFSGSLDIEFQHGLQECFFDVNESQRISINMFCAEIDLSFAVLPQLNARAISIPFQKGKFSLLIFLPRGKSGVDQLIDNLSYYNNVREIVKKFENKGKIHLRLPCFKIEQCLNMNSAMKMLGAASIFDDKNAHFVHLEKYDENIHVSSLIHTAQVDIHCDHEVAAGKNNFDLKPSNDSLEFHITHPFFFVVYDDLTQSIAVAGRVTNPQIQ